MPSSWVDHIYSSTVFAFAKASGLDDAFAEVGMYLDWGILSPFGDEIICDNYGTCATSFYECAFSTMSLRLPFIVFEI